MFVETITANVVRFPLELREASLLTLGDVEPDVRQIDLIAEAFGLDVPEPDIAQKAEIECLDHLASMQLPEDAKARRIFLRKIEREALRPAIAVAREVRQAKKQAAGHEARAAAAKSAGDVNAGFFECLAEDASRDVAVRTLAAFRLAQRARGVSRVIGFALRGESWTPFDIQAETEWLIAAGPGRPSAA